MNNPWSIIDDKDEHNCSWCEKKFKSDIEGELIVMDYFCAILCGDCLSKYTDDLYILYYEKENIKVT